MSDLISNREILDLLETEGSLDYLLLTYGLQVDMMEDQYLADLFNEITPILEEIHERLDLVNRESEEDDVD